MTARWEYRYEAPAFDENVWYESFNKYLNAGAAEGWELVSVRYRELGRVRVADVIWRR